jgi:hypothetical protein
MGSVGFKNFVHKISMRDHLSIKKNFEVRYSQTFWYHIQIPINSRATHNKQQKFSNSICYNYPFKPQPVTTRSYHTILHSPTCTVINKNKTVQNKKNKQKKYTEKYLIGQPTFIFKFRGYLSLSLSKSASLFRNFENSLLFLSLKNPSL